MQILLALSSARHLIKLCNNKPTPQTPNANTPCDEGLSSPQAFVVFWARNLQKIEQAVVRGGKLNFGMGSGVMEFLDIDLSDLIALIASQLWDQFYDILRYPIDTDQRIHVLYLLSAVVFALLVFARKEENKEIDAAGIPSAFFQFLFPASVWKNPSAWLDVRYFLFHHFIWGSFFAWMILTISIWFSDQSSMGLLALRDGSPVWGADASWAVGFVFVIFAVLIGDLVGYVIHYLQHRVPFLWAFHKVHHSLTVMHPISNYREHPMDNIVYFLGASAAGGLLAGFAIFLVGHPISSPQILGTSIFAFAFNFFAYNLRHSHIWLRWPFGLNKFLGSPAHHQVHHSFHPDHIDKNFAFLFSFWDVLFGTFCLPETNEDVQFGLGNGEESQYNTCIGIYTLPFKQLWRARREKQTVSRSDSV